MGQLTLISPSTQDTRFVFWTPIPGPLVSQKLPAFSYQGSFVCIAPSPCNFLCTPHFPLLQYTARSSWDLGYAVGFTGKLCWTRGTLFSSTCPFLCIIYTALFISQSFCKCVISICFSLQTDAEKLHWKLGYIYFFLKFIFVLTMFSMKLGT